MRIFVLLILALLATACGNGGADERPPYVVVVNRAAASLSVIDPETDEVVDTVALPAGAETPRPGYVVYSSIHDRLYVGDEANRRVIVLRATDFEPIGEMATNTDAFHMWRNDEQLWVVDRTDFSVIVFSLATESRITAVPIPADLRAMAGVPHDVVVDATHAYVTITEVDSAPDVLVKYSTSTFTEVGRVAVGDDPHVILHPTAGKVYVACQETDDVHVVDRDTMTVDIVIPIFGGHGVWVPPHGQTLYVTNFPSHIVGGDPGPGADGVFAVNLQTNTAIGGVPTPESGPHNLVSTADGTKLYVTHSNGGTAVSVFSLPSPTATPVYLRNVDAGLNPFGICLLR